MARTGRPRKNFSIPSYKGGHTVLAGKYVREYAPHHPNASKCGMVSQHRLVMEDKIGRILERHEIVHHIDRNPMNNSPDNLELLDSLSEHMKLHSREISERNSAKLDERDVVAALRGRTTLEASKLLGVHHMTLRLRFGHLLTTRISPHLPTCAKTIAIVLSYAADESKTYRELAADHKISYPLARKICQQQKVRWIVTRKDTIANRRLTSSCALQSTRATHSDA